MRRFRSLVNLNSDESYHKSVDKIVADLHPTDSNFPWDRLRDYTDACIKKQKGITIPDGLDFFLTEFIRKHRHATDIAVAACAHALSTEATQALLTRLTKTQASTPSNELVIFIQILVAINHFNPTVVNDLESNRAKTLLPLLPRLETQPGRLLEALSEIFIQGIPVNSLLAQHITVLARKACLTFSAQLDVCRKKSRWVAASSIGSFLASLQKQLPSPRVGYLSLEQILSEDLPCWRSWAAWRPDHQTITTLEHKLTDADRSVLRDMVDLEGPSFDPIYISTTAREGLAASISATNLTHLHQTGLEILFSSTKATHVQKMLQSLSSLLLRACTAIVSTDSCWLQLYKQICLDKQIDETGLQLLQECFNIGQTTIINTVKEVLFYSEEKKCPPLETVCNLMSALETSRCHNLQRLFGIQVVDSAVLILTTAQELLTNVINVERAWGQQDLDRLVQLQGFGKAMLDSKWVMESLDAIMLSTLKQWPFIQEVKHCYFIRTLSQAGSTTSTTALTKKIDLYLLERLVHGVRGTMRSTDVQLVENLVSLWRRKPSEDCETIAMIISQPEAESYESVCQCLTQLPRLDKFLTKNIQQAMQGGCADVIVLSRSLAATEESDVIDCWKRYLMNIIEEQGEKLMQYALQNLEFEKWVRWIDDLAIIFMPVTHATTSPFFRNELHRWVQHLRENRETIKNLEESQGMKHGFAMHCLLRGGDIELQTDLNRIIDFLSSTDSQSRWEALQCVTACLERDGKNSGLIRKSVSYLTSATPTGADACKHVLETYAEVSTEVAETMLAAWYDDLDLMPIDKCALEAIADVLHIDEGDIRILPWDSLKAADRYFEEQAVELLTEARRLESLRLAFKAIEPEETAEFLAKLGIEDSSPLDDIFERLPADLIDVVERVGSNEVELHIPLNKLTELQKKAMGSGSAQSLLVRLFLGEQGLPPGFCIHLDNDSKDVSNATGHFPWVLYAGSGDPEEPYCHGRQTPAVYQLSRLLSQHMRDDGFTNLKDIYQFLTEELTSLSSKCIVCAVPHAFNLRRSTTCADRQCQRIYDRSHVDVRLSDIRQDPAVVDLLLTMVYATACSNDLTLVPGCPIKNVNTLKNTINDLPAIANLQNADSLELVLKGLGNVRDSGDQTTKLLTWICTSYKGFLASASPPLRIPSLPGSHQFLLANSCPKLEINFAAKVGTGTTRVMFHGTSFERLHSILCQGLKDMSGTALQRHGASFGKGIYVSTDPATAWGYATNFVKSWNTSTFSNCRVLLGCELAGHWTAASGNIHVITDPSCLMVRYVWLLPNNMTIPLVQHVTPAMQSIYASLRSRAI